jgi:hypothetical protein
MKQEHENICGNENMTHLYLNFVLDGSESSLSELMLYPSVKIFLWTGGSLGSEARKSIKTKTGVTKLHAVEPPVVCPTLRSLPSLTYPTFPVMHCTCFRGKNAYVKICLEMLSLFINGIPSSLDLLLCSRSGLLF